MSLILSARKLRFVNLPKAVIQTLAGSAECAPAWGRGTEPGGYQGSGGPSEQPQLPVHLSALNCHLPSLPSPTPHLYHLNQVHGKP